MSDSKRILITGGGPVGLLSALLLARHGLPVTIFDNNPRIQLDPRAATTHPATLEVLGAAGLTDDMIRVGLVAPIFQFWDRSAGKLVAEFDHGTLKEDTAYPFAVQCEQFKTSQLILDRLSKLANVELLFDHEVVEVKQSQDAATVVAKTRKGEVTRIGAYLIGADGGRSIVRKGSDIDFEGFTYAERFLVLTTPFDFQANSGFCYRSYFADPQEWCNCFKVSGDGPPGLWRTVFPTDPAASDADLMCDAAVQQRIQRFFPRAQPYEIVHRNLYVTHQRVASTFRKGRVLLAGDAAHVNNSIGGMGLNGGLQDAANVAGKLARILVEGEPDSLLDLYSLQRRTVTMEFVQAQTIANKKRLEASDPEARKKNLDELSEIAADPTRARAFMLASSMITMQRRADGISLPTA